MRRSGSGDGNSPAYRGYPSSDRLKTLPDIPMTKSSQSGLAALLLAALFASCVTPRESAPPDPGPMEEATEEKAAFRLFPEPKSAQRSRDHGG